MNCKMPGIKLRNLLRRAPLLSHGFRPPPPDAAILDAALKDGPCQEVALALGKRAVPFLIYSGFSADRELIADFADVTWIEKPVPPAALVRACHQLLVSEG